jgi:hypothetical protein
MASIKDFYNKNKDTGAGILGAVGTSLPLVGTALNKFGDYESINATKENQADIDAQLAASKGMVGKQVQLRPELSDSIAEARKLYQEGRIRAETGFDTAQTAAFNANLDSQTKGDRMAAMEVSGGQGGNYIGAVLNNRKANTLLDFASKDAGLKLEKANALTPLYNNVQQNAVTAQGQQNLYDQALAKTISDLTLNKYMLREDLAQKRASNWGKYANEQQQKRNQFGGLIMKTVGGGGMGGTLGGANPSTLGGSMAETGNYNEAGTMLG